MIPNQQELLHSMNLSESILESKWFCLPFGMDSRLSERFEGAESFKTHQMKHEHHYTIRLDWTGNSGSGSSGYKEYERSHLISAEGKAVINGSSDPAFRGDATLYNPEELFLSSLSSCHMLWYLTFAVLTQL